MNSVKESLQKFSRAVIVPVKFMAVMGLVLAVAVILQMDIMPTFIQTLGLLLNSMMNAMLNNLAIIFAVGIAASLANKRKVEAGLVALIAFLIFLAVNNTWLDITNSLADPGEMGYFGTGQNLVLGFQVVDMNVFLGMLIGALVGYVHNKFSHVEFPAALSIYGESRLTFIILIPIILAFAILMAYVWPVMNNWIASLSDMILTTGLFGLFIYAFLNRFLVPTGLHHLLWMPFGFTALGGTAEINGEIYSGAVNIIYAQMVNANSITALDESLRFAQFGFVKIFGSIAVVLAFVYTAKKHRKAEVQGQLYPSMLVAVLAGITEPLDFAFLFASPLLWFIHSLLTAISETLLWALGSRTYMLYGVIDTVVVNSVFPPGLTKFYIAVIVGLVMMVVWFGVFVFVIKQFDLKTPGREDDADIAITTITQEDNNDSNAKLQENDIRRIVDGLGGSENISTLTNCYSRLRVDVNSEDQVDVEMIEGADAVKGVFVNGNNVQVVIGMGVQSYRDKVAEVIGYKDE